jgi:processive 1,2-diacylglycerol beta-glucosyltransferase
MASKKKVLLLYITERSGHHSAALAIKSALLLKDPDCACLCVNAFKYVFPIAERVIHFIYLSVIKRVPIIWESMYDNQKLFAKTGNIKRWVHNIAVKRLKRLLDDFKPDAIVCTQAFPCGIVADYKKVYSSKIPLIACLTDFSPHSFWVYDAIDHYIVPCDKSKGLLVEKGVPEDKIQPLGIPIDPKFSQNPDKRELFANFGLQPDIPVIMIMGGGHGLGPIKDIIRELESAGRQLQLIVVCGINRKLYHWINKTSFNNRILNFKFTDQIDRLMSVSSLIITKPGGVTTAEALAKRLPMMIVNPIPGQESRNTQILVSNKAAVLLEYPDQVTSEVFSILEGDQYARADLSFSKPRSSMQAADLILNL